MFLASIWFPPNAVIGIGTDCAVSSLFLAVTTTSSKTDVSSSAAIENEGKMRLFRPNGKLKTLKRGQIKLISKEAFFKTEQNNIELIGDVKIHQSTNNMKTYFKFSCKT